MALKLDDAGARPSITAPSSTRMTRTGAWSALRRTLSGGTDHGALALIRTTSIEKLAKGGDRSIEVHLNSRSQVQVQAANVTCLG